MRRITPGIIKKINPSKINKPETMPVQNTLKAFRKILLGLVNEKKEFSSYANNDSINTTVKIGPVINPIKEKNGLLDMSNIATSTR